MNQGLDGELNRLKRQNRVLMEMALAQRQSSGDLAAELQRITEGAAQFLGVQRVGVWLYRDERRRLDCVSQYDLESSSHGCGESLSATDFPRYFDACWKARSIDAHDAATDPRTSEFAPKYLPSHGITSMLDAPIFLGNDPRGIICHEHVGLRREWTPEELAFASSMADFVAIALAASDRQEVANHVEKLVELAAQGIVVVSSDGEVVRVNEMAERIFDTPRDDLLGTSVERVLPQSFEPTDSLLRAALRGTPGPQSRHLGRSSRGRRRDGHEFPAELSISRITRRGAPHLLIMIADVTERDAAEARVRHSERLYRSVVEDQTDFILRAEGGGRIVFANQAVCDYFETSPHDMVKWTVFDFVPSEDHDLIRTSARSLSPSSPVISYSHRVRAKDGSYGTITWTLRAFFNDEVELIGYQAIGRDVTREKLQEARLHEAQRLESLAVFAGGMAHDLNNLLTPILAYTDQAVATLPQDLPEVGHLRQVMVAATRARELAKQVLIFSRREESDERRPIDASPFIRETVNFVRSSAPATVRIVLEIDTHCGVIRANPSDLYQVLSNLCANAVQSMPAGGSLSVTANEAYAMGRPHLQIVVRDTGTGIASEILPHLFDPFFTTKPRGEGTGLGLSMVRGIVGELGGTIDVQSEVGKGSSFAVVIPTVRGSQVAHQRQERRATTLLAGTERILVVDDEPSIASLLRDALGNLGYSVVSRTSANEALTAFENDPQRFDALITDFTMPYMTGVELAWRVRRKRPDLPIIMISGFGQLFTEDELRSAGIDLCVKKPFKVDEITRGLRLVLAGRVSGSPPPRVSSRFDDAPDDDSSSQADSAS